MKICMLYATLAAIVIFPLMALALEPTTIEPVEPLVPHVWELEQSGQYIDMDTDDEWNLETEITYSFNRYLDLGVTVPFVFEEGEDGDLEDVALFIEGIFNPDSDSTRIGGELKLDFPTGEDSSGLGGEVHLRITQPIGASGRHALHLNLTEFYDNVEEEDHHWLCWHDEDVDKEFRFAAALGYSFDVSESTTLLAVVSHEQDYDGEEDANMAELGITHDFSDAFGVGLGVGAGLDSDSPDFEATLVFQLSFGAGK